MRSSLFASAALVLVVSVPIRALETPTGPWCTTAREYVTTLDFLRGHTEFAVPETEAREMAREVSRTCTGSGGRFIAVMLLLTRAGLTGKDASREALAIAKRSDADAATFVTVFRMSYLEEYLDLELPDALRLAHSLTSEFAGDMLGVREDFETLVHFCVKERGLDLPRPKCAELATRIARKGEPWSGGIADSFLKVFRFVAGREGAHLTTATALSIAEDVIAGGPGAAENFIQGYRYAVSPTGLGLTEASALKFAREMAGR